ncbi:outer membrane lipid asymmetry maintenance protein MlaD [Alkalimonas delamerensis]|uniref:Outer membrane lipid asymmetry maintenance protein MlaD n=1 Tax=Alkalimonas delamerensis TaxID=265981 RepID=A0ABT9GKH9_9GAMM|nr:outer membrane lipid asymmetry maintenance protein MlaD [Alkalimonas delamerensis]MDP4527478.1 outer membrane lipid asymmetry maintenance protein MlaD [Alkalimonas delamerensis]
MNSRKIELLVGVFVAFAIGAFLVLALKVANTGFTGSGDTYTLYADFENIGGLRPRSPVKVGGVVVGRVAAIELDKQYYTPRVRLEISRQYDNFPETSSLVILTSGLLGEQYLGLQPGFIDDSVHLLQDGDLIEDTRSAMVLEELIGQFLFNRN